MQPKEVRFINDTRIFSDPKNFVDLELSTFSTQAKEKHSTIVASVDK